MRLSVFERGGRIITEFRATVCITAHYAPARVRLLATVLEAIVLWPAGAIDVVLVSNTSDLMGDPSIVALKGAFSARGGSLRLELSGPLPHPYELTWAHKKLVRDWLSAARACDDYFVYIEDDIVLTAENFSYFRKYLPMLKPKGLLPGFLRYEIVDGRRCSVDFASSELVFLRQRISIDAYVFLNPYSPYWAGFILDRDLASEYAASDSFDIDRSKSRSWWPVRERAAMGLTWENPPPGFPSRCVVPLRGLRPADECLVWHCAQNYSSMPDSPFGRLAIDDMFVGGDPVLLLRRGMRKVRRALFGSENRQYQ